MHKTRGATAIALIAVAVLLMGCAQQPAEEPSLTLTLADVGVASKTLVPTVTMQIHHYNLVMTKSGSVTKTINDITGTTVTVSFLDLGVWNATVSAYNNETPAIKIGEGIKAITIVAGANVASIDVNPLVGNGTLQQDVYYRTDLATPTITSSVKLNSGTETPITLAITDYQGVKRAAATTPLASGWYTLKTVLKSAGLTWAGIVEYVRIVKDYTTSGYWDWTSTSSLGITIIPHIVDPLTVTMTGTLPTTLTMTQDIKDITAVVTGFLPAQIYYAWYVDDWLVVEGTDKAIILGTKLMNEMGLTPGPQHRFQVLVYNPSGDLRCGSFAHVFTITP
jgi:hypothetical protein